MLLYLPLAISECVATAGDGPWTSMDHLVTHLFPTSVTCHSVLIESNRDRVRCNASLFSDAAIVRLLRRARFHRMSQNERQLSAYILMRHSSHGLCYHLPRKSKERNCCACKCSNILSCRGGQGNGFVSKRKSMKRGSQTMLNWMFD